MRLKGGEKTCDLRAVRIMLVLWEKIEMIMLILPFLLHSHQKQNFRNVSSFVCIIQLQKDNRILTASIDAGFIPFWGCMFTKQMLSETR